MLVLGLFLVFVGIGVERTYRLWMKSNVESCLRIGVLPSSTFCSEYTSFKEKSLFLFALYKIGFHQTSEGLFFLPTSMDKPGNTLFLKATKRRLAQQKIEQNNYDLDDVKNDIDLWLSLSADQYESKMLRIIAIKDILYVFNTQLVSNVDAIRHNATKLEIYHKLSETAAYAFEASLNVASDVFSDSEQCKLSASDQAGIPSAQLASSILALTQSLKNIGALDGISIPNLEKITCRDLKRKIINIIL